MIDFQYSGRNNAGQLVSGVISAESVEQASELLSRQDLFVTQLASDMPRRRAASRAGTGRATRRQVAWFMSQLSIMVEVGIPLSEALHITTRQVSDPRLRALIEDITKRVDEGSAFSVALAEHPRSFPPTLTALIRASELNGSLSEVLGRSSQYLVRDLQTLRRIRGAMIYPIGMVFLTVAITIFLLTCILPRFEQIFASRGAALPTPTRVLMAISGNLVHHWFEWCVGLVAASILFMLMVQTRTGKRLIDSMLLSVPPLSGVFHGLYQSRTFRTVSALLSEGVPIMDVIAIARDVTSNSHYRELWDEVEQHVRDGNNMSAPMFRSRLIPEPVAQMIEAGERSGRLSRVLAHLSDYIEEEYNQTLKTAMKLIEPAMILVIGTLVGFIAAALMLPLFQASRLVSG